jgi:cytochrome c biogenesis protein CcmG/thiol:disulfide interchange protein DsbE
VKQLKRPILVIIAIVLLVSCSGKKQADAGRNPQTSSSKTAAGQTSITAPNFILENADGQKVSLADYRGKVIILNFWATWCSPCRAEIPDFIELQDQYGSKGLQILGVSVDQEGWKVVKPFITQNNINYPIFMTTEDAYKAYQGLIPPQEQGAIPFTFIIGKDGTVHRHLIGSADKAAFEGMVKPLLEG